MAKKKKKPRRTTTTKRSDAGRKLKLSAAGPDAELVPAPLRRWIGLGADIALALICLVFLIKSAGVASKARFFTDECFHTYIVEELIETGNSPAVLYELYSGMANNTHPLFHWLAAPFHLAGGRAGLAYVNVVLCGVLLGSLYWILRAWVNPWAARIAVSVTLLFGVIHICTQIFYVEILSALTFTVAALAITVALSQTDWKAYFLAGAACALALLSKQTGYVLLPVVALCGLCMLVRRRWRHVIGMAVLSVMFIGGFGVGMWALSRWPARRFEAIYAPVEKRTVPRVFRLFGRDEVADPRSARAAMVYDPSGDLQASGGGVSPRGASSTTGEQPYDFNAEEMLQRTFGGTPKQILGEWWSVLGPLGAVLTVLCLVHTFLARRQGSLAGFGATAPLLLALFLLLAGAVKIGTVDRRHFISWVPVLAACTAIALTDLTGRIRVPGPIGGPELVIGAGLVLLLIAFVVVVLVPDYRIAVPPDPDKKESMTFFERLRQRQWNQWRGLGQDAPPALVAAAESIAARAEDDRRVLSVWTSSTWYYSGHPATWAGFNVPKYNTMLLDPSRLRAYQRYVLAEIGYVLVDNSRIVPDRKYGGVQYPETGILHLVDMLGSGVARVIYPDMDWLQDEFLQKGMPVFSNRNVPFLAIEIDAQRVLAEYVRLRDEGASGESGP